MRDRLGSCLRPLEPRNLRLHRELFAVTPDQSLCPGCPLSNEKFASIEHIASMVSSRPLSDTGPSAMTSRTQREHVLSDGFLGAIMSPLRRSLTIKAGPLLGWGGLDGTEEVDLARESVRMSRPAARVEVPLVLDSPHSGTWYPADFRPAVDMRLLRKAEDTHVEKLFSSGPALGATLIAALFPRSYIDCNRERSDIDVSMLSDSHVLESSMTIAPSSKSALGKGLIWRLLDDGTPVYDRLLTAAEVQSRVVGCYDAYHAVLNEAVERLHRQFGALWHINCHSMPSRSEKLTTDRPGLVHPDIVIGDRDGSTCTRDFRELVAEHFQRCGYSVWINDPYKGVAIVDAVGCPSIGRHSLQLELNRRLYMDEESLEPSSNFSNVCRDIEALIDSLRSFIAENLRRSSRTALAG